MALLRTQQTPALQCQAEDAPMSLAGPGNALMSQMTGGLGGLADPVGSLTGLLGDGAGAVAAGAGAAAGAMAGQTAGQDTPFNVPQGQLTFDAEGTEGGRYHSRHAHWPGGASGVTIGRGYDVGQWTPQQIQADFDAAGISPAIRDALITAAGLRGQDAGAWVQEHRAELGEITPEQQKLLFERTYARLSQDVQRISSKDDVVERYGQIDWEAVDPAIRDLLVDLRYRGDYTGATRRLVQELAVNNDVAGLTAVMSNRELWRSVPPDRFQRRMAYMQEASGRVQQQQAPTGDERGPR
jgi:hypothetical protein